MASIIPSSAGRSAKGYAKIKDQLKGKNPNKPELHTPEQIKLMLAALTETLKGNQRFQQVKPFYHKGGEIHFLNDKGEVVSRKDDTWVGHDGRLQHQPQRGARQAWPWGRTAAATATRIRPTCSRARSSPTCSGPTASR